MVLLGNKESGVFYIGLGHSKFIYVACLWVCDTLGTFQFFVVRLFKRRGIVFRFLKERHFSMHALTLNCRFQDRFC